MSMEVGGNSWFCSKQEATIGQQEATIEQQENINVDLRKTVKRLKGEITIHNFAYRSIAGKLKQEAIKSFVEETRNKYVRRQKLNQTIHKIVETSLERIENDPNNNIKEALTKIQDMVEEYKQTDVDEKEMRILYPFVLKQIDDIDVAAQKLAQLSGE